MICEGLVSILRNEFEVNPIGISIANNRRKTSATQGNTNRKIKNTRSGIKKQFLSSVK